MGPPHSVVGRPINELVSIYLSQCKKKLSVPIRVAEGIYVSRFCCLFLSNSVAARDAYCKEKHTSNRSKCLAMLRVAHTVLSKGYCTLTASFKEVNPTAKYSTD